MDNKEVKSSPSVEDVNSSTKKSADLSNAEVTSFHEAKRKSAGGGVFVAMNDDSSISSIGEDPEGRDPNSVQEENILAEYSEEQVMNMGRAFAKKYELPNDDDIFARGAALARKPNEYDLSLIHI